MSTTAKTLYDTDFVEWTARTAELVRSGRFDEVDLEHVAEEIEDLGKRDRASVESLFFRLVLHQVKRKIQPELDGESWRRSIVTSQRMIIRKTQDSPRGGFSRMSSRMSTAGLFWTPCSKRG